MPDADVVEQAARAVKVLSESGPETSRIDSLEARYSKEALEWLRTNGLAEDGPSDTFRLTARGRKLSGVVDKEGKK